jgi:hypothetical protein
MHEECEDCACACSCVSVTSGVKFILTARPGTRGLEDILRRFYDLYTDYVLKVRGFSKPSSVVPAVAPCDDVAIHHAATVAEPVLRDRHANSL